MTKKMCVAFFTLVIALSFLVSAFTASISNPRMVLYTNLSEGKYLPITNSVIANNVNNHSVQVFVAPKGIWEGKVSIAESNFSLEAGERKEVFYTITIDKAGYYEGDISITFKDPESKNTLSPVQDLVVIAQDKDGKVPGEIKDRNDNSSSHSWTAVIIVGIIVLLILIMIVSGIKKGRNKQ